MELSLEARLSKQHLTNSLQAQVTGTFVSAETGVQAPKMPYRFTASCSASPLQAEGVTLTALFWTHLFAFCGSEQPSTAQWHACMLRKTAHSSLCLQTASFGVQGWSWAQKPVSMFHMKQFGT